MSADTRTELSEAETNFEELDEEVKKYEENLEKTLDDFIYHVDWTLSMGGSKNNLGFDKLVIKQYLKKYVNSSFLQGLYQERVKHLKQKLAKETAGELVGGPGQKKPKKLGMGIQNPYVV